jgi:hypothetical protein
MKKRNEAKLEEWREFFDEFQNESQRGAVLVVSLNRN